jgi:hypothetical protein
MYLYQYKQVLKVSSSTDTSFLLQMNCVLRSFEGYTLAVV